MAFIAPLTLGVSVNAFAKDSLLEWKSDDGTDSLKLGGVVRLNQRYEDWEGPNRGFGKLYFDIFRVDLKGKFDDAYINASYLFQDQQKTSIEKAYVGYNLDANNSIEAGLVYKPFTIYPYPQNGWTYHIPFFLGYGNNIAPGLNWNYHDKDWDVKLGYYPQMLETNLRYSPESATYDDLQENAFPSQKAYQNEKRHQFNTRIVRKLETDFGKQEFGVSGAIAQLHNKVTDKDGKYYAVGLHTENNYKRFNLQSSVIHYQYDAKNPDGVNSDMTLMGNNGFTPAYFIASEGTIASLNLAYTLPVTNMGKLKAIKFYNDYSYLDKKRDDWSDSQMNTTGMMFIASPFMVWADYTWGKNSNIIGGATNSTGYTSATSPNSDKWLYRINFNIGFTF
ncbi:hypothetical protein C7G54_07830 [Acinetobacter baumannii]|nr:hypothetical protein [Acinetobacter baumannii]ADX02578.1 Putative uncharacterized protein [Acinetobacter baumannii 1656-2]AEP05520.2 hypothetical protein ABZJ_01060 [Acinetobacter baumannii MDR-ZJ06]AYX94795.1 hypothetical protein EG365_13325 [Acinetobacter sp. FDAARGOS_494]AYY19446.1 hypothetical protein EG364_03195 [Acinetobacter sp. FDAARGOS_560]EGK47190.1 hypothetical protein AB210_2266 [Acinetobacter baumannii AB210]KAA2288445.1 hypothetical protein F1596_10905 [Acinetobacter sp. AB11